MLVKQKQNSSGLQYIALLACLRLGSHHYLHAINYHIRYIMYCLYKYIQYIK